MIIPKGKPTRHFALVIALAAGAAAVRAQAAPPQNERAATRDGVVRLLERTPSAAGGSVMERVRTCRLEIDWSAAQLVRLDRPNVSLDLAAGDSTIFLPFTSPGPARPGWIGDVALWSVRRGRVRPVSHTGWDRTLQDGRAPIRLRDGRSC